MTKRRLIAALAFCIPGSAAAQNVAEVQVAPPSVTIRVGERSGLLATAFDRIGNVIPTIRIIWSSNNVGVAKVDNSGTVTGVSNGVAIIEARVGARKGQAAVQVTGGSGGGGGAPHRLQHPRRVRLPRRAQTPSPGSRPAAARPPRCASSRASCTCCRPRTRAFRPGRCARTGPPPHPSS